MGFPQQNVERANWKAQESHEVQKYDGDLHGPFGVTCDREIMLDNIKHSIVLLQIAKNTAHPVNGIYHQRPGPSNNVSSQGE
ncbi:hypothetical protein NQ317_013306 [Molorchus minor]|uniref:Uncharacterized protein n=1 Tax=Molorchus minor TaxID=1323400 RepID=A0ABQ9JAI0_9CUCU|nr:hypothetical protein NQ317_013306 [Molorchus minor]